MRKLCRASFAHSKQNVLAASLASYLIRHGSRFYFSHSPVYCPLKDLIKIQNRQAIDGQLLFGGDS